MNKINLKIRLKNPVFIAQIVLAVLTPILAYAGLTAQDLTTWGALGKLLLNAVSNPYVLSLVIVSVWNAINDPTTSGVADSERALNYTEPKNGKLFINLEYNNLVKLSNNPSIAKNPMDSDKSNAPDGIVGPRREKEGSYYAIRAQWSDRKSTRLNSSHVKRSRMPSSA